MTREEEVTLAFWKADVITLQETRDRLGLPAAQSKVRTKFYSQIIKLGVSA